MTISIGATRITLADDSPNAQKIREGYDYTLKNGKLAVLKTKSGNTKWAKAKRTETATLEELREIVSEHIRQCGCYD